MTHSPDCGCSACSFKEGCGVAILFILIVALVIYFNGGQQ